MYDKEELIKNLWYRGVLVWKLHLGQLVLEEAYQNSLGKSKLFVADCSRQLGKSTWAAIKCVETALQRPKAKIRIATAFLSDLEQFIMPAFEFALDGCPPELEPKWNSQKYEYRFRNGSKIRLVGLDKKPNGLRGNRLDLVIIDEAGYVARLDYLYKFVLIPATTHVPTAKLIFCSTQPESPDHDFVKYCDKAESLECYVKLDVYKNPLLTKDIIDELAKECGGYNSTAFRREYLCERIVESERAIIPEFNYLVHVASNIPGPYHNFWYRLESIDSGVRDMTACLFAYYDFERSKLFIEDEFAIKGSDVTTRNINKLVREKETLLNYHNVYRRVADNDNLILLQDLGTEYNLHFTPTSKDELAAMVNKVRIWFSQRKIEIHPRCEKLIGALKAGIWNKKKIEFERSEVHGHFDLIASLIYLVRNCPDMVNPIPQMYGVDLSNQLFVSRPQTSATGKALKDVFFQK